MLTTNVPFANFVVQCSGNRPNRIILVMNGEMNDMLSYFTFPKLAHEECTVSQQKYMQSDVIK